MNTSRKAVKFAAGLIIASMGGQAAWATLTTEMVTVTPTSSGVSGTITFSIPQFNPALGTLNGVELTLTPTVGDLGYSVYNVGAASTVAFAQVSDPYGSLVNASLGLNASWSSTQSFERQNFSAAPGINTGSLPFSSFAVNPSSVTVGSTGFTGAGDYNLVVNGSGIATSSGSPGYPLFYGWYGNVGGSLEVDFNYTPVPEPTTLVGGALLLLPFGAGTVRKLRNRAA